MDRHKRRQVSSVASYAPLFAARLPGCSASRGFVGDSWYLYHDLPCNLPCAASPANHRPARPRAQRTSP